MYASLLQAMLEDKLKATDWEAADEDIAEMVARESYLQWVKDNQKTTLSVRKSSTIFNPLSALFFNFIKYPFFYFQFVTEKR